jgi:prepilin-type N-terminal cleavage/methylation domain-containing protein
MFTLVHRAVRPHRSSVIFTQRRAFSLIELIVCIAIVSIMVISLLSAQKQADKATIHSVAVTAQRINEIASCIYAATGNWPADVNNSNMPPEMRPYLANNIFLNDTPLGGRWDWNGPTNSVNNSIGIALRFSPSSSANHQQLQKLDQLIDDGDLSTGECFGAIKSGSYFYIIEATKK